MFRKPLLPIPAVVFLLVLLAAPSLWAGHGAPVPDKTGILLVAFGTSVPQAQKAFDHVDARVRAAYPDTEVRWAFTSSVIRRKLAAQGRLLDSPAQALARMLDQGFSRVAVQSLHTIPGQEYHALVSTARSFQAMAEGFAQVRVGLPLLATTADVRAAARAAVATLPAERGPDDAVVLVGHGTHHPADVYYAALQHHLRRLDPNVFVTTVSGAPTFAEAAEEVAGRGAATAYLAPFMAVAGDHARNDMAGDGPDSLASVLRARGVRCVPVLTGTAELDAFVDIWLDHLEAAMAGLHPAAE
jgi:sirohydrochlorin cobaltochelatase